MRLYEAHEMIFLPMLRGLAMFVAVLATTAKPSSSNLK